IAVGLIMGMARTIRAAFEPLLTALFTVPKLALLPLLLLILGIGEAPKRFFIGITVFFFMWIATMTAIMSVSESYREPARAFGATRRKMLRHVLIPASLPQVFVGLRLCAGISVALMAYVEFLQGFDGIGHLIWYSWSLFLAARMYVGIVTVGLM